MASYAFYFPQFNSELAMAVDSLIYEERFVAGVREDTPPLQ
jgi:hypothetical protein